MAATQCIYTYTPPPAGGGWSHVDYGCAGKCPSKPVAYNGKPDPTVVTVVITDCAGTHDGDTITLKIVDDKKHDLDIIAASWNVHVKRP
jgi:hypothetical protein